MKIYKLTKNFHFIENEKFKINKKQEIISLIEKAEKNIEIEPSFSINVIQKALGCIVDDFIEINNISIKEYNAGLSFKIKAIQEDTRIIASRYLFALMREINEARNYEQHELSDKNSIEYKFTKYDVINKLKNFFTIISYLYSNQIKEIYENEFDSLIFDEDIYLENKEEQNISAISPDQRAKDIGTNLKNGLTIDQDCIKSWLTIKNSKLIIPIYQRKYEWEEENVNCLLEDIQARTIDDQKHYFGTIAQKKTVGLKNNDPNQIKIIDGQQRITTSFLLICAARDILKNEFYIKIDDIDWYMEISKIHNNKLENYLYNPGGTIENNESFRKILNGNFDVNSSKPKTKFDKNYSIIYKYLKNNLKSKNEIIDFVNIFLLNFQVASINFEHDKFPNKKEMELFENLNTKGLELAISDLVKNYIFNFCNDNLLNEYEKEISLEFNNLMVNTKIENKNTETANEVENFYSSISELITGGELPDKSNKRKKFQIIKTSFNEFLKKYNNLSSIEEYRKMINYLQSYILIYMEVVHNESEKTFLKLLKIEKIINIISDNKKRRLFSYYTFIIYDFISNNFNWQYNNHEYIDITIPKSDIQAIQKMFMVLTKFLLKTKIMVKQGDSSIKRELIAIANKNYKKHSNINEICENIINDINDLSLTKCPNAEIRTKLLNAIDKGQITDLFVLVEYYMNNLFRMEGEEIKRNSRTVEHIMPVEIEKWIEGMNEKDKEEFKNKHNEMMNKIGNYLLLTSNQNSSAKNYLFLKKKETVYKNLVSPLYKNNDHEDIDVSRKNEWTFENINKRTQVLCDYIMKNVLEKSW